MASGAVTRYENLRLAAQECKTVDEAKDIADRAKALAQYAREARDPDLERWVTEIRLRAKRRIGELSMALETAFRRCKVKQLALAFTQAA